MTKVIEAIYADGVLKPTEALELPEQQRVELTMRVIPDNGRPADDRCIDAWPQMEGSRETRQAALDQLFDEIDRANLQLKLRLPTRDELHERR